MNGNKNKGEERKEPVSFSSKNVDYKDFAIRLRGTFCSSNDKSVRICTGNLQSSLFALYL